MNGVEAQINYSLNNNLIERIPNKKLKVEGKGRTYNPSKPPSKILTKVAGSLYKKQFPEESKTTRRIRKVKETPEGSAKVLSNFDKYGRVEETRVEDGEVGKEVFNDFIKDFGDSQKNKENAHFVEFEI